jgi:hypothetical protein
MLYKGEFIDYIDNIEPKTDYATFTTERKLLMSGFTIPCTYAHDSDEGYGENMSLQTGS